MPVVLDEAIQSPAAPHPKRKPLTREECAALEQTCLWEGKHFELIEGELIDKRGKNQPHVLALRRIVHQLEQIFTWILVFQEAPIDVAPEDHPTSEPEPDVFVLKRPFPELNREQPKPADLALVVEIADSTLAFDTTTKAALYARAQIPEYWVLDLKGRRLIVQLNPSGEVYKSVVANFPDERVAPQTAPGREILVSDLLD